MGFFWLLTGVGLLRLSVDDKLVRTAGNRTTRTVAIVGILAGLLLLTRDFTRHLVPEATFIILSSMPFSTGSRNGRRPMKRRLLMARQPMSNDILDF